VSHSEPSSGFRSQTFIPETFTPETPTSETLTPETFAPATLELSGFPTISFDGLVVGEQFRSDDRHIRPLDVEAYAFAVEDYDPWFFEPGPFGGPIAHPTLLANQALFLRHHRYLVPAGLHARMVFEFCAPVTLGTRARSQGQLLEKYVRRDKA
jgi:acyl dehydratase